MKQLDAREDEC